MEKQKLENIKASDKPEDKIIGTVNADKLFELYDKIKASEKTKHALEYTYRFERLWLNHPHIVQSLPMQTKAIMISAIRDEKKNIHSTYENYKNLCEDFDMNVLTKKRVEDLLFELQYLYSKVEAGDIQNLQHFNMRKKRVDLCEDIEQLITNARQNQEIPLSRMEILGILELVKLRYFKQ